jgi:hypothetical protein
MTTQNTSLKFSFGILLALAVLLTCSPPLFGQLSWNSYNNTGGLVGTGVAQGGDATYGGSVMFTVPASTQRIFATETFAPVSLPAASTSIKVNFSMNVSGGLYPGSTGRLLGMGLFNDPGTPSSALDDQGYWCDFNTSNPSFELFYRTNTVTTFFQYDSAHKPGAGTVKTGYPTNGVTYGMQFQLNMNSGATSVSIGTSTGNFATAGAAMTNGNTSSVNQLAYSSANPLTTLNTTNFNEFAFSFNNTSASAVTVTLTGITLVPANPVIANQPLGYSGSPGDNTPNADFTVTLNGNAGGPLSYQWYEATATATNAVANGATANGSTISGATNASLSFTGAQVADSGSYFVVVTNVYGAVTSSVALLNIASSDSAPVITSVTPVSATVIAGHSTNITVSATGSPSPVYYWYDNNNNLLQSGAAATLTLANVQPANAGTYSVVASNYLGNPSSNFVINVIVTPSISSQPTNLLLNVGDPANFSVTATGTPAPTYQWYKNNVQIGGATATNYSIGSVTLGDIGTYTVVVSNSAGATTSSNAVLAEYSTMTGTPTSPSNNATGVCRDTLLTITFSQAPAVGNTGAVKIYDASNPGTPVDTLNLAAGNLQFRSIGGVNINSYEIITSGNSATIYPHAGVLTYGKTYYVTMDPGVIVDTSGAYFTGLSGSNAWQFTVKSSGPANATNLVVAADGSGDFATVQGAIDSVPAANTTPTVINIRNGLYTEINRVNSKNNITFIGQSRSQTVIAYANNNNINGSSTTRPMFGVVSANDIAIENLTLTNSTPHGGSQAEALLFNLAKRGIVLNATLCSYQDTLLVNQSGDQAYVQDSHIQGDTDYIWGSGTLYCTNDELMAMSTQSYLTQARTAQNTNGFAFVNCRIFAANSSVTNGSLGRDAGSSGSTASYPYGQTAYINCTMDTNLIVPGGWVLGSGSSQGPDTANLRFWEFQSIDTNGNPVNTASRVAWSTEITGAVASNQVQNVTNWLYGWQPALAPLILTNPSGASIGGGQTATFAVAATGIADPSYQWQLNGNPINGATNSALTVSNAYAAAAGTYTVVVSNATAAITSAPAVLTVSNTAPTLAPISDQTIGVGITLNITNAATDPDVPPQTLTFTLSSGPPTASLNPGTGIFTWRAPAASVGTTNPVTIVVSDNGSPVLSATQSFNIIVNPVNEPTMSQPAFANGQLSFTVNGDTGPDYIIQTSLDLLNWQSLSTNNSPTLPFIFTDTNATAPAQYYRVLLGP